MSHEKREDEVEPTPADAEAAGEPEAPTGPAEDEPRKPRRRRRRRGAAAQSAAESEVPEADAAGPAAKASPTEAEPPVAEAGAPTVEAEIPSEPEAPVEEAETPGEPEAPVEEPAAAGESEAAVAPARRGRRRGRDQPEPRERPAKPAPSRRRARQQPAGPPPVVRAQAKYVRSSARKARLVCDHIRGKTVEEARAILAHTPRAVARDWSKLLESAVANAEHNHELVGEDLYVKAVTADEGPTIRRFRPRAMGRATRIRKRTSHLTILLTPKQ
jgi:ribosomal protein L22